jgi:hypothetical protein
MNDRPTYPKFKETVILVTEPIETGSEKKKTARFVCLHDWNWEYHLPQPTDSTLLVYTISLIIFMVVIGVCLDSRAFFFSLSLGSFIVGVLCRITLLGSC